MISVKQRKNVRFKARGGISKQAQLNDRQDEIPAGEAIATMLKSGARQSRENAAKGIGQEQNPGRTATKKK